MTDWHSSWLWKTCLRGYEVVLCSVTVAGRVQDCCSWVGEKLLYDSNDSRLGKAGVLGKLG